MLTKHWCPGVLLGCASCAPPSAQVVVRVRPLSGREGGAACVQASSGSTVRVDKGSTAAARHEFAFDRVAGPEVGQEELFAGGWPFSGERG